MTSNKLIHTNTDYILVNYHPHHCHLVACICKLTIWSICKYHFESMTHTSINFIQNKINSIKWFPRYVTLNLARVHGCLVMFFGCSIRLVQLLCQYKQSQVNILIIWSTLPGSRRFQKFNVSVNAVVEILTQGVDAKTQWFQIYKYLIDQVLSMYEW